MTESEVRAMFTEVLAGIAPEADLDRVGNDDDLREALDLDSMDFMNLVVGLHHVEQARELLGLGNTMVSEDSSWHGWPDTL